MNILKTVAATVALVLFGTNAGAEGIAVHHAYAIGGANPATGAAFMVIHNETEAPDRLVEVRSEIAALAQLHLSEMSGDGVMSMVHVEDGFDLPQGGTLVLERGGTHVMFMGLHEPLTQGREITITLVFEIAGEVMVTLLVDNETAPTVMDHSSMDHGTMDHGMGDQTSGN